MLSIRPVRPEERAALYGIWRRAVEATHSFLSAEHLALIDEIVRERYLPQAPLLWVAELDGEPAAFAGMAGDELESLFVDPRHTGRGLGRALVEYLAPQRVEVNEQNEGARGFYERLGFRVQARRPVDSGGLPYPILELRRAEPANVKK